MLDALPALRTLQLDAVNDALNLASDASQANGFGDVCCDRNATNVTLSTPRAGDGSALYTCGLSADSGASDQTFCASCVFYENVTFAQESSVQVVSETDVTRCDATSSVRHCGAQCEGHASCTHFTWTARDTWTRCLLYYDPSFLDGSRPDGTDSRDAATLADGSPAVISGIPARTRAAAGAYYPVVTNSSVILTRQRTQAAATVDASYALVVEVMLGTAPLRGAVWYAPYLSSLATNEYIRPTSISPSALIFYTDTWDVPQTVTLHFKVANSTSAASRGQALSVGIYFDTIQACDEAFTLHPELSERSSHQDQVNIYGEPVPPTTPTWVWILCGVALLLVIALFSLLSVVITLKRLQREGTVLRLRKTGAAPVLPLPPGIKWHLFLSHTWATGQDQVAVVQRRLVIAILIVSERLWMHAGGRHQAAARRNAPSRLRLPRRRRPRVDRAPRGVRRAERARVLLPLPRLLPLEELPARAARRSRRRQANGLRASPFHGLPHASR